MARTRGSVARDYDKRHDYEITESKNPRVRIGGSEFDPSKKTQTHQKGGPANYSTMMKKNSIKELSKRYIEHGPTEKQAEAIRQQEGPHRKDRYRFAAKKKLVERR